MTIAGVFTDEVPDFAGQFVKDADKAIVAHLKALGRVAWCSAVEEGNHIAFGLAFQEIAAEDQDRITQFIIRAQMPG